jgi:glycosyltransferase involved in cell wall biosynthesis
MNEATSTRPRVCFVNAGRFGPPLDATQARKFQLLAEIADVHVVGLADGWRPRRFTTHARFHLLPRVGGRIGRYLLLGVGGTVTMAVLALRHRVDVLVAQSPYEAAASVAVKRLLACLGRSVACVVESHGDFEVAVLAYRRVRLAAVYRAVLPVLARFSGRQADALRAVSRSTARQLARVAAADAGDVHVFHTWTDLDRFFAVPDRPKCPGLIVYAGTLVPAKGVHLLLQAFAAVARERSDARLALVGRAENPSYATELHDLASRLALTGRVEFRDRVPQDELATLVQQSQALVLASTSSEGLPRVLLEAMASGTAVVTTAIAGAVDVVRDGETGFLVTPGSIEELANRLGRLLAEPHLATRMGAAARAIARRDFSVDDYRRGYARLFRDAIAHATHGEAGPAPAVEPG